MSKFHSNNVVVNDGFIHATGELDADLYKVEAIIGIQADTIPTLAGDKLLPYINPFGVNLIIDRRHVDVTVTGSILSNFADVIAKIFTSQICDGVEVVVEQILNK
jgi:monomeric isocitrate dehydrogenase